MTTAAEIEAAVLALPPAEREPLLERVWRKHLEDPAVAPPLTPEQVALLQERIGRTERGDERLHTLEEATVGLREAIMRVGAGEDPDLVLAEHRARRNAAAAERETADVV